MPWMTPVHPSLGLGLLSSILETANIASTCLYGNLLLPPPASDALFAFEGPELYEDRTSGLSFVPHLYPAIDAGRVADAIGERFHRLRSREGHLQLDTPIPSVDETRADIEAAGVCLERCMAKIGEGDYDIVGFSLMFETQLVASLALARRIKERWPRVKVIFGGAACASGQGVALLKSYGWIDVVCLGEGDMVIVPLVKALRGEGEMSRVKGITYRSGDQIRVNEKAETITEMDWLPVPNYDDYFVQKKVSGWAETINILPFETSRGCWWGEKHLCTFCGLNGETLRYRSKSAGRVLEEIAALSARRDPFLCLQAVDNIFDMRYFKELIPRLIEFQAGRAEPVRIFFEIKSNLKRSHLFLLAAAGIFSLQPGIESFSDNILRLMDKGASALQQIMFIKWANQVGISSTYNILLRNPGETAEDYRQMIELLPYISHLQPPNGIGNMQLQRYSPYFLQPDKFEMRNVRPHAHYRVMFPDPAVLVEDIVYEFDFDHAELDAPDLVAARSAFTRAILNWKVGYKAGLLSYRMQGGDVVITDLRGGAEEVRRLRGAQAEIFLYLDQAHTFTALTGKFPQLAPMVLRSYLSHLVSLRLVYHHVDDYYLALPLRAYYGEEFKEETESHIESLKPVLPLPAKPSRELTVLRY